MLYLIFDSLNVFPRPVLQAGTEANKHRDSSAPILRDCQQLALIHPEFTNSRQF
jgi:hypothetical protein